MTNASPRTTTYAAIADRLRTDLLRQLYADGKALPTEAQLAIEFGVSRQTIRRAFRDLVDEGMVYRVPGRGTFAAGRERQYLHQFGSIQELMGLSIDVELHVQEPLRQRVNIEAASRLRLDSDAVMSFSYTRDREGVPFCVTWVYVEPAVGAELSRVARLREGEQSLLTVIEELDEVLPRPVTEVDQSITAELADASLARQLGCEPGIALIRIDRVFSDGAGVPRELAISHYLPEHYSYRVRLQRTVRSTT